MIEIDKIYNEDCLDGMKRIVLERSQPTLDREAALREICNGIKASATDKSQGQGR